MLKETRGRLQRFGERLTTRPFRLEDDEWLTALPAEVDCFVSSLVIHHIDGDAKRKLYRKLFERLSSPGALLIVDLIAPRSEPERRYLAQSWDEAVLRQSWEIAADEGMFRQFQDDRWNWYEFPDPGDMPSTIPEHLEWLAEAGFEASNVFWHVAGHALYGGYKGVSS
jgi:tRNA (cmo5U34)-methyltransferase